MERGYILVSPKFEWDIPTTCFQHELMHFIGFQGHSRFSDNSILGFYGRPPDFTKDDKFLIRTFYDDRVKPGMRRGPEKGLILGLSSLSLLFWFYLDPVLA